MEKEKALDVIKRQIGCYKNSEEQCFTLASCRGCKYNATIEEIIEAMQTAIFALKKLEQIIKFIESRKQLHSSPVWYEFAIVKELDEVKRFVEKIQAEEDNG